MRNFFTKLLSIAVFLCSAMGVIVGNVNGIDITYFCLFMGVSAFIYFDAKLDDLKGEDDDLKGEDDEDVYE